MKSVFVQTTPSKISVTETYYYKTVVGDMKSWEFDKAQGEIEIEFLYDGHRNGSFNLKTRQALKRQDPKGRAKKALVGHLAIVNAGKSAWQDWGFEGKTIPLTIDIENFQEKLESSQKLTIQYGYRLNKPEDTPLFLGEVLLTDQEPIAGAGSEESKPQYYPSPTLFMNFNVPVRDELLQAQDLSQDRIKDLIDRGRDEQVQEITFLSDATNPGQIANVLLALAQTDRGGYLFIGVEPNDGTITGLTEDETQTLTQRVMEAVLTPNLPLPIIKPSIKQIKDKEENKKLGMIIVPPKLQDRYRQTIQGEDTTIPLDFTIDQGLVKDLLNKKQNQNIAFVNKDIDPKNLAKIMVSLANYSGGYVGFGFKVSQLKKEEKFLEGVQFEDRSACDQIVEQALKLVKPALTQFCRQNWIRVKNSDDKLVWVLALQVEHDLPELYSVEGQCWRRASQDHGQFDPIALEPDETFELMAQKYASLLRMAQAIGEPPEITFGYIERPYTAFDLPADSTSLLNSDFVKTHRILPGAALASREQDSFFPSKYDPSRRALEWHKVQFVHLNASQFFETQLRLPVKNPEELRQTNGSNKTEDLSGHFDIFLGSTLLSGLEIAYFDALGNPLPAAKQRAIISQKTMISLDITLRTSDLFRIRNLYPYRRLEFEGVLPESGRYDDIVEVLKDCGLRIQRTKNDEGHLIREGLPRSTVWFTEGRSETGKFSIILKIINRWHELQRQISYGERIDSFSKPSGRITIIIVGSVEGAENRELTQLLNQLQWQLKERFKHVKVG